MPSFLLVDTTPGWQSHFLGEMIPTSIDENQFAYTHFAYRPTYSGILFCFVFVVILVLLLFGHLIILHKAAS
jgi:hypothetical protein